MQAVQALALYVGVFKSQSTSQRWGTVHVCEFLRDDGEEEEGRTVYERVYGNKDRKHEHDQLHHAWQ